jgi:hypothetical protein
MRARTFSYDVEEDGTPLVGGEVQRTTPKASKSPARGMGPKTPTIARIQLSTPMSDTPLSPVHEALPPAQPEQPCWWMPFVRKSKQGLVRIKSNASFATMNRTQRTLSQEEAGLPGSSTTSSNCPRMSKLQYLLLVVICTIFGVNVAVTASKVKTNKAPPAPVPEIRPKLPIDKVIGANWSAYITVHPELSATKWDALKVRCPPLRSKRPDQTTRASL